MKQSLSYTYATQIQTLMGTFNVEYNAENRPVRFENVATQTVVECAYDSQGRRFEKKVTVAGITTLHHRYIYRGYLQIAALDLTRSAHPALWFVTWDPSQPVATRPLAIQKDGTWFTYGYDLTKNICEVFGPAGYIRTAYSYAPFGAVTASGDVTQPFQWSSEFYDSELDLVYYNYRHYSPSLGRFLSRDPIEEQGGLNLYAFVGNNPLSHQDYLGKKIVGSPTVFILEEVLPGPDLGITATNTPFAITTKKSRNRVKPSGFFSSLKRNCYKVTASGNSPIIKIRLRRGLSQLRKQEVLEHEMMHFSIYSRNWSLAGNELNQLEGIYCSWQWGDKDAGEFKANDVVAYGEAVVRYYMYLQQVENTNYDIRYYGNQNSDRNLISNRDELIIEVERLKQEMNVLKEKL